MKVFPLEIFAVYGKFITIFDRFYVLLVQFLSRQVDCKLMMQQEIADSYVYKYVRKFLPIECSYLPHICDCLCENRP